MLHSCNTFPALAFPGPDTAKFRHSRTGNSQIYAFSDRKQSNLGIPRPNSIPDSLPTARISKDTKTPDKSEYRTQNTSWILRGIQTTYFLLQVQ